MDPASGNLIDRTHRTVRGVSSLRLTPRTEVICSPQLGQVSSPGGKWGSSRQDRNIHTRAQGALTHPPTKPPSSTLSSASGFPFQIFTMPSSLTPPDHFPGRSSSSTFSHPGSWTNVTQRSFLPRFCHRELLATPLPSLSRGQKPPRPHSGSCAGRGGGGGWHPPACFVEHTLGPTECVTNMLLWGLPCRGAREGRPQQDTLPQVRLRRAQQGIPWEGSLPAG